VGAATESSNAVPCLRNCDDFDEYAVDDDGFASVLATVSDPDFDRVQGGSRRPEEGLSSVSPREKFRVSVEATRRERPNKNGAELRLRQFALVNAASSLNKETV
jgi:hypothetical protein